MLHSITDDVILSNSELSELDKKTIEFNYIPAIVLMEEASEKIIHQLVRDFKNLKNEKIAFIAGWGNNGGDGLSIARKLFFKKIPSDIFVFSDKKGSPLYQTEKKMLEPLNIMFYDISELEKKIDNYTLVIDAVFGISYRDIDDKIIHNLFKTINSAKGKVVSIDTPSGLNAENHPCVTADFTYSIGYVKKLFFNICSRKNAGIIRNLKISLDLKNLDIKRKVIYLNKFKPIKKITDNFVHKYSKGSVLSIGGSAGKFGSIIFSAVSALRTGAGISLIGTEKENIIPMNEMTREVIIADINDYKNFIEKYTTIIIGPGLSFSEKSINAIKEIITLDKQFILDASFFSIFDKGILSHFKKPPILTPHSQEFKTFFTGESDNLNTDTTETVITTAKKYNCFIILKDSYLTCSDPEENCFIFDNPVRILAQAGSGDIFSGILAGTISQGYKISDGILESIRTFYKTANYLSKKGFTSYSPLKFINLLNKIF